MLIKCNNEIGDGKWLINNLATNFLYAFQWTKFLFDIDLFLSRFTNF
jgi:hypothetical protein